MGRPAWEPTAAERKIARRMVSFGITYTQVAQYLGINEKTLVTHLGDELDRVKLERNVGVAENLFVLSKRNPACAIFLAKTQLGWRETADVETERPIVINLVSGDRPVRLAGNDTDTAVNEE